MNNFTDKFTEQMREQAKDTAKYQQVSNETQMLDKPVSGILELQPEMGSKLTVNAFLTWLKSVEDAWGKVSAGVTQVLAKLRSNLRVDADDLRKMLSDKMNERLFTSLSDKVGGTLKKTVWPSQKLDGIGYLFAVLRVAVAPDQRDWSKRLATFYDLPEIVPVKHLQLENAFQAWLMVATEVIYSTQFTAESAKENLRQFLKYYPDLVACVDSIWQGSNKDYEVLEQIFVQLKREVAEATTRLSRATKHRWGNEHATAEQEDAASKNRSNNSGRGRARRGSSSDAEKEPKKEGSRQRSASEPDINAAKKQGKGKGKGRSRKLCWDYCMLKPAPASMVTTVDLCMKCPRRNQRKKDREVAVPIRHSRRRLNMTPKGELCGTPSKMMISKRPRPRTRMQTHSRWSECCARKWQS